jgi:two-component system, OmpR family, sensor histidine kinase KdpD
MPQPTPESFLRLIRRRSRGRLKVYLGYAPGVGKTYQMLLEAHRLRDQGLDVVAGYVEDHGRPDTRSLVVGLEELPRRRLRYRGIELQEMDVAALLERKPEVAVVDELAHTNAPGGRNGTRYQDVVEALEAGISVLTTLNVQHLESLYDTVERLVGVKVKERVPDWVLAEADQVVNVDLATEDLEQRLRQGKVYPAPRIAASLAGFFRAPNLAQLRELALREAASRVRRGVQGAGADRLLFAPDQVMVCLSSKGPDSAALLRYGSRLAGRLDRNWYALYVRTPEEEPSRVDGATQRQVGDTLALAHQLGATVFTFKGTDVAETILRFAREYGIGHIVVGRPGPRPRLARWLGRRTPVEELIERAAGFSVVVIDPRAEVPRPVCRPPAEAPPAPSPVEPPRFELAALLDPCAVAVLDRPIATGEAIDLLVSRLFLHHPEVEVEMALRRLRQREEEGSTQLAAGFALPHARIPFLPQPLLGLALAPAADGSGGRRAILLLLCPEEQPASCVEIMGSIARLAHHGLLVPALLAARDPGAAVAAWRREVAGMLGAAPSRVERPAQSGTLP